MIRRPFLSPSVRSDAAGDGHFGACRGDRTHRGTDFLCVPGSFLFSPIDGKVTKLGYAYATAPEWRYVQITDDGGHRHRMFYANPLVQKDELVVAGQIIGECQDISDKYPDSGMAAHIHYEIIDPAGEYMNPEETG